MQQQSVIIVMLIVVWWNSDSLSFPTALSLPNYMSRVINLELYKLIEKWTLKGYLILGFRVGFRESLSIQLLLGT